MMLGDITPTQSATDAWIQALRNQGKTPAKVTIPSRKSPIKFPAGMFFAPSTGSPSPATTKISLSGGMLTNSISVPMQIPSGMFKPTGVPTPVRAATGSSIGISMLPGQLIHQVNTSSGPRAMPMDPIVIPISIAGVPQIGFDEREGIWIVSAIAQPALKALLSTMVYAMSASDGVSESGQANVIVGQTGNAQGVIDQKIASGSVAMVDKASLATGVPLLVFTKDPSVVVAKAGGASATHGLLTDKPDAVVAAALASMHGGTVPPSVQKTSWLVPGLIGAGVILLGILVFKPKMLRATPNARGYFGPTPEHRAPFDAKKAFSKGWRKRGATKFVRGMNARALRLVADGVGGYPKQTRRLARTELVRRGLKP